eukprot:465789_1
MSATEDAPTVNQLTKKNKPQLIKLGKTYGLLLSTGYKKNKMAMIIIERIKLLNKKKNNQNKKKKTHKRANTINIKRRKQDKKNINNSKYKNKAKRKESRNSAPYILSLLQSNSNTNILGTEALSEDQTNDHQYQNKSET